MPPQPLYSAVPALHVFTLTMNASSRSRVEGTKPVLSTDKYSRIVSLVCRGR